MALDKFQRWIDEVTIKELTHRLRLTRQTAHYWRDRRASPRLDLAIDILTMAKGALTWQDIYEPYARKVKSLKKAAEKAKH
jgi:hypothetical protein